MSTHMRLIVHAILLAAWLVSGLGAGPLRGEEGPPVPWMAGRLEVWITPDVHSAVTLELELTALEPSWVDLPVAPEALRVDSVTLDGEPLGLWPGVDGHLHLVTRLTGVHQLRVTGQLHTPGAALDLWLPPASRRLVHLPVGVWEYPEPPGLWAAEGLLVLAEGAPLQLSWREGGVGAQRPASLITQVDTALTLDEGEVLGVASVLLRARNGAFSEASLGVPEGAEVQEVVGARVRSWSLEGSRLVLRLEPPLAADTRVIVRYRQSKATGERVLLPLLSVTAGPALEGWLALNRAGEVWCVPRRADGLTAVPNREVPPEARALSAGAPLLSWRSQGPRPSLEVSLLSFSPADLPPTLIDEAHVEVQYTEHGRALMSATYQVRNDRSPWLKLAPPPGWSLIGARVAGRVVSPAREEGGAYLLPLEKSFESLRGLVAFPVEVYFWGEEAAWTRRGLRDLKLPSVDAPVARSVWQLWLPPGVTLREAVGSGQLQREDEGTRTWGEAGAAVVSSSFSLAKDQQAQRSVEAFNYAWQAYQKNDFDTAGEWLEEALEANPENESAQALQGNVALIEGGGGASSDDVQARRVLDMARARSVNEQLAQQELAQRAEANLREGNVEEAQKDLEAYLAVTESLAQIEQPESLDQKVAIEDARKKLKEVKAPAALAREGARDDAESNDDAFDGDLLGGVGGGPVQGEAAGLGDFESVGSGGAGGGFGYGSAAPESPIPVVVDAQPEATEPPEEGAGQFLPSVPTGRSVGGKPGQRASGMAAAPPPPPPPPPRLAPDVVYQEATEVSYEPMPSEEVIEIVETSRGPQIGRRVVNSARNVGDEVVDRLEADGAPPSAPKPSSPAKGGVDEDLPPTPTGPAVLVVDVPRAGTPVRMEQSLLHSGEAMYISVRYHFGRRP